MAAKKATSKKITIQQVPVFDREAVISKMREMASQLQDIASSLALMANDKADAAEEAPVANVDKKLQAAHDKKKVALEKKTLRALKALATKEGAGYEFEDDDVADASMENLIKNMLIVDFPSLYPDIAPDEEDEDEDDDDEESDDDDADDEDEEDEDEDDEEDEEVSREELMKLDLKDLKKMAVANGAYAKLSEMKGLDRDTIVDAIMELDGEDEDEEEGDDEYYTREDYEEMSLAQLKAVADESGVEYKKGIKQGALIDLLLAEDEEEDEE